MSDEKTRRDLEDDQAVELAVEGAVAAVDEVVAALDGAEPERDKPATTPESSMAAASYKLLSLLTDAAILANVDLPALQGKHPDKFLGDVLVDNDLLKESEIQGLLIRALHIPWVPGDRITPSEAMTALVSEAFCREHQLMPIGRARDFLTVAVANPLDTYAIEKVQEATGLTVRMVLCSRQDLQMLVATAYNPNTADDAAEYDSSEEEDMSAALTEATEALAAAEQAEEAGPAQPAGPEDPAAGATGEDEQ